MAAIFFLERFLSKDVRFKSRSDQENHWNVIFSIKTFFDGEFISSGFVVNNRILNRFQVVLPWCRHLTRWSAWRRRWIWRKTRYILLFTSDYIKRWMIFENARASWAAETELERYHEEVLFDMLLCKHENLDLRGKLGGTPSKILANLGLIFPTKCESSDVIMKIWTQPHGDLLCL